MNNGYNNLKCCGNCENYMAICLLTANLIIRPYHLCEKWEYDGMNNDERKEQRKELAKTSK